MTLPTRLNAIFSTLQGTQNPDTKPTLQRAKNANAQPTHHPADGILFNFILHINKTAVISKSTHLKNKTVSITIKFIK
jgi:hypothetical protein